MLLDSKTAVIYGAGGAVGSSIARAFAAEGAQVFLAGRTLAKIQAVATEISATGGVADAVSVDALDEQAVEDHLAGVTDRCGRIDVLFNAIGMEDVQGTPLVDLSVTDFAHPVLTATKTQFITARAAARRMIDQGSGVIMSITAEPTPAPDLGGFPAACAVIEALWRSFATELGPHGVRTIIIRSAGSPDSPAVQGVFELHTQTTGASTDSVQQQWGGSTMLGRLPLLADVSNVATLLASDRAEAMTAAIANVTCGAFVDH